ncbi:4Fe-4S binding protein [Thermodesulfobacteriota bacterium]
MNDVYKRLAKHLDDLPAGFPATESGVELRILKRFFSPEEAEIAMGLSMRPEPASAIAKRLDMDSSEMEQTLENMSKKGLVFRIRKEDQPVYMAAQFVVGIWEYHLNDLDEELIKDFNEYSPYLVKEIWAKQKTKQLRVIPVSQSISAEMAVMPYEEAEEIIKSQSKILVAPCICRKEHAMVDKGCDKPLESCLVFGAGAYYYKENKLGRFISQEEALQLLQKAQESGLVLQPGNAKKTVNICTCCGCCCQILKNLKEMDNPAEAMCTNYYARVDEDECASCGTCVERCQMDAVTVDDVARIDVSRCIGCGLCVTTCEVGAIRLVAKDEANRWVPPENMYKTYIKMARERGKN